MNRQPKRLAAGGLIDRTRPLSFSFDGKAYTGFAGDTLASALLANNVRLVGRSFKYHRPRGILTAGSEEPNALVTLRSGAHAEPNSRATVGPLIDGLVATSQNRWPSLAFDVMAINQLASPIFVAGFYYKTFMWPAAFWEKLYEPLIRRAAGLGALSMLPDPDHYDRSHGFCDLLVIGAGPSGLAAALAAGRAGLRVIIADQDERFGGRLLAERHQVDGIEGVAWAAEAAAELATMPNVTSLPRTSVFGVYDGREYGAVERISDHLAQPLPGQPRQRLWKIVASHALLASGAIERPIVFGGNDRPGVMMASAVSAYINRFAVAPGKRALVFTTSDSGWSTAEDLVAAGCRVAAVVDPRASLPPAAERLRRAGVKIFSRAFVTNVAGRCVRAATIVDSDGRVHPIEVDLVAMAGGWNPAIGIGSNLGSRPSWSDAANAFLLDAPPPGMMLAGAATGALSLAAALASGVAAAARAGSDLGVTITTETPFARAEPVSTSPPCHVPGRRGKSFVDFQNDVTDSDIDLAAREGFTSVELLKRYTTLGMATDQGKTSQVNGHALLAAATGKAIAEAGTILSRPPYLPVAIGALAGHHRGEHFRPERHTASHQWAVEQGATFVDTGQWKRAQWFARPGERDWLETVSREVNATRGGVGICDVSTLGKIDVHGRDAGLLLDRLYVNTFSTLPIGKARYGLMLREDGFVLDDGTTTRFAEDRFFVTTTTVNAARVMQHIDFARQVLWPEFDVQATSVTEQWSTYAVAGPRSRLLLQKLLPALDLSNEAFPYMGAAEFEWMDAPARLFRLSFSGELAYEISVPACFGDHLVRALFDIGSAFGVIPYGTEALGVMRIEKGHAAGNELNGQTTARDLGLGRMMSQKKDFIGRVMAQRPGLVDPARPTLVGIRPKAQGARLRAGAHLLAEGARPDAEHDQGFVTSVAFSPTLDHWIGLALLDHGPERHGEAIVAHDPVRGPDIAIEVCSPVFVDPEGTRLRG
ncbi:MAG: sarcosine oxidase subunit alpha family protein [Alphaproteobacteria bacterium]|nr:sarcosine oxidase subunit alpha family protein [Alphaproteobacteria bacterium]